MALGRDFWLFRFGQLISVIGDACSNIALAWWILDKTGSAAKMSAVLAPAMFIQIILTPLAGPIGDRFPRKKLVLVSDIWRGVFTLAIASMVFLDYFNLPLLIVFYVFLAVGGAIFNSVSTSIVPQLVSPDQLPKAMQQTQAISAAGGVAGGIAGGLIVSLFGVGGAFLLDAMSFLAAAIATAFIRANTLPTIGSGMPDSSWLKSWASQLAAGIRTLTRLRLLLWLSIVSMAMNFVLSPIGVILPVLVKQQRNLPPWFLGALESSVSLGTIIGALMIGKLRSGIATDKIVVIGLCLVGIGIGGMGWVPTAALPLVMMLIIGFGVSIAQVPMSTSMALAVPDDFRSRITTIRQFLGMIAAPLGVALAGPMISRFGLIPTLAAIGVAMFVLSPALFAVPLFSEFFKSTPDETRTFLSRHYKGAFKND
ncbi:MAG: hypothetical protein A2X28_00185 [Elusimicrobia bacterium GWA2_56_46]|nr:MAG: hypothetical protein A2X28_00185 [Elusimicrobia bacterium GWA2_56_46]OGR55788.1 MAG: hypothetical protein A2X39_05560 [Elusimicrobia bacterium GWC2_56_31]HBB67969.1 hypothetical protein [Elusimicrobiota bacterium]HBW22283.1 hypothetical protein [Elusimicrobiota bacterium]